MKDCDYCRNAFVSGVDPEYDGSYISVGSTEKGYNMRFGSAALNNPPVCILVDTWCDDASYHGSKGCNVDVAKYAPKYCPECGRRIKENDKYRKLLEEKNLKKSTHPFPMSGIICPGAGKEP